MAALIILLIQVVYLYRRNAEKTRRKHGVNAKKVRTSRAFFVVMILVSEECKRDRQVEFL